MLDLAGLRNPIWRTGDRLRDPAVLPVEHGYLVFYSRFSAGREWTDPQAWAVDCAFTHNFHTFAHDRDVTAPGLASPGAVVARGGPSLPGLSHSVRAGLGALGITPVLPGATRPHPLRAG
jgi:hypothetical protein